MFVQIFFATQCYKLCDKMKKSLVILFAVIVAVASAARLPEADSRPSLGELEPFLQKIFETLHKIRSEMKSEDAVPEVSQQKEIDDSLEEFRQKPMNLKALAERLAEQQHNAVELSDQEDGKDSDLFLSYGLDKPVKFEDLKKDNENEDDEEEEETEDKVPVRIDDVEEAIEMAKEDDPDVQISYGLAGDLALNKGVVEEEEDDEDNQSIIPVQNAQEEDEQLDDSEVQVSFGLAEPIAAAAVNLQEDVDDEDNEEDDEKPTDLNEKVMSEIMNSVIQKFAKAYRVKL